MQLKLAAKPAKLVAEELDDSLVLALDQQNEHVHQLRRKGPKPTANSAMPLAISLFALAQQEKADKPGSAVAAEATAGEKVSTSDSPPATPDSPPAKNGMGFRKFLSLKQAKDALPEDTTKVVEPLQEQNQWDGISKNSLADAQRQGVPDIQRALEEKVPMLNQLSSAQDADRSTTTSPAMGQLHPPPAEERRAAVPSEDADELVPVAVPGG